MDEIEQIANGGPMDPVPAIRLLAGAVMELRGQMANPSLTLPASGEGTVGGAKVVTQLAPDTDELDGLFDDRLAKALRGGGFDTVEKIAAATDEELLKVNGVGPAALKEIRQAVPGSG
ncbi:hypothetical protein GC175_04070 [bacterium]|nr:hypothetical protein [bacterium]